MLELLQSTLVQQVAFVLGGLVLGLGVERLVVTRLHAFTTTTKLEWDDLLLRSVRGLPTLWFGALGVYLALSAGEVEPSPWIRGGSRSS
jgi:hypothetical protein